MKHGHVLMTGVSTLLHLTGYDWSCILSVSLPFKSPASCGVLPAQSLTLIPQNWDSADMRPYSATGRQGFKLLAQYPRRAGGLFSFGLTRVGAFTDGMRQGVGELVSRAPFLGRPAPHLDLARFVQLF